MDIEEMAKVATAITTTGVFLWIALTSNIQGQILGMVLFALVIWSLYPERHFESSIIVVALLSFFQVSLRPSEFLDSLFSTYGGSGLWIIVSGFVLAKGIEASGLGRRIALWITTGLGAKPERIVLSVAVASFGVAPLSPSTTAKAFLVNPVCIGLAEAFGIEKRQSRYGAGVLLMAMAANNICSTAFLTATVPNPISAGYIADATGVELSWLGWLIMALPLTLLLLVVSWLILMRMFRPEVEETVEALERIRSLRGELGPLSRGEMVVAGFFGIALLLWITNGLLPFNAGLVSLILSLVMLVPGLGVMEFGEFTGEVPWGSLTLFAASMFLAKAVGKWSALDPIAKAVFQVLRLEGVGYTIFVALVVFIFMFIHVVFTSTTVYATVMVPLAVSLAKLQGLNPMALALPVSFLAPIAVVLPVNTIPNIVFYQTGYFNQKQIIAYGIVLSLFSVLLVLVVGLPYWGFLGLLRELLAS